MSNELDIADLAKVVNIRRRLKSGEIRADLIANGVRFAEVARALRLDDGGVNRWLHGTKSPDVKNALRLADLLDALGIAYGNEVAVLADQRG